MRKFVALASLFLLLLGFILVSSLPMTVYAIGEVTPTPAPDEEEPEEELDVEALIEEGIADLQAGSYRSAISNMDLVLEIEPDNVTAYLVRGVAFVQLGLLDDAHDDFSEAIGYAPYLYELYLFRGDTSRLLGDSSDALLDYDAAVAINPLAVDAFARRSDLYYELGDEDAGDFDDLMVRGLTALGSGDIDDAIDYFSEALDINVDDELLAVAYYDRGIAHSSSGDEEAAVEDYTSAMDANPDLHNAYLARGIQFRLDGDLQAAGEDFLTRITLHENERIEESMEIGETIEVEMVYRRVYAIEFTGEAGQEISITARDTGDTFTDPLIAVLDPDGNPIAGDDDLGGGLDSEIAGFELPEDGTYTLLLSHAEGGYNFGFEGTIEVSIEED